MSRHFAEKEIVMNEKFEYIPVLESQLAIDYDCTAEEVHCQDIIFRVMKRRRQANRKRKHHVKDCRL